MLCFCFFKHCFLDFLLQSSMYNSISNFLQYFTKLDNPCGYSYDMRSIGIFKKNHGVIYKSHAIHMEIHQRCTSNTSIVIKGSFRILKRKCEVIYTKAMQFIRICKMYLYYAKTLAVTTFFLIIFFKEAGGRIGFPLFLFVYVCLEDGALGEGFVILKQLLIYDYSLESDY